MKTTLCFDFGNTRLKCAVFNGDELKEVMVLEDDAVTTMEKIIAQFKPGKSILSSVINHDTKTEDLLAEKTRFHKLTNQSKLPFSIPIGKPETIGTDRLALAAAAVYFHPRKHNLVIAMGSCITYNFINKFHAFLGGSISPGLEMRFNSMHDYTALLPLVKPDLNFPLIGYDTKTNLQSGAVLGTAKEIDGIINEYALRYSNFNVHLTGGDMRFFVPLLKNKIFASPDLIFKGLYALSETNA